MSEVPKDPRQKWMFLATLVMFGLIALMLRVNEQNVFANKGRLAVSQIDTETVKLTWYGEIRVPMARRFDEAFTEWGGRVSTFVIDLDSPGGSLAEGQLVIEEIRRAKRRHHVETRVGARRLCLSMCVPIFLEGDERLASPSASFMFHQPISLDFFTEEQVDVPDWETRRMGDAFLREYFLRPDVDREWVETLRASWDGQEVWKTAAELADEKAGIVTALE